MREEIIASRPHDLGPNMSIIAKQYILKCSEKTLTKLIYENIISDKDYLKESTQSMATLSHSKFTEGTKCLESQEEADIIITKHVILCGKDFNTKIKVISHDTVVFAPLCHFCKSESIKTPMIVYFPVEGQHAYDIRATVLKRFDVIHKILSLQHVWHWKTYGH